MAFRNPLTLATVVTATEFELVDDQGNEVAEFGVGDPYSFLGPPMYQLDMRHYDPATTDSKLAWTVATPRNSVSSYEVMQLSGPREAGTWDPSQMPGLVSRYATATGLRETMITPGDTLTRVATVNTPGGTGSVEIVGGRLRLDPDDMRLGSTRPMYVLCEHGNAAGAPGAPLVPTATAFSAFSLPASSVQAGDRVFVTWSVNIERVAVPPGAVNVSAQGRNISTVSGLGQQQNWTETGGSTTSRMSMGSQFSLSAVPGQTIGLAVSATSAGYFELASWYLTYQVFSNKGH